jgi:large subunit ribosomal protein L13
MSTIYLKQNLHIPKWFLINAAGKTLGRLASNISQILTGKNFSYNSPGLDQGHYLIIINSLKIKLSGNKKNNKLYYSNISQRPGNLKIKSIKLINQHFPNRILEKAIWGMISKTKLGYKIFKRLYIYKTNYIPYIYNKKNTLINLIKL